MQQDLFARWKTLVLADDLGTPRRGVVFVPCRVCSGAVDLATVASEHAPVCGSHGTPC